jgi:hypothetical protein
MKEHAKLLTGPKELASAPQPPELSVPALGFLTK